jgi:hypothetical protein
MLQTDTSRPVTALLINYYGIKVKDNGTQVFNNDFKFNVMQAKDAFVASFFCFPGL